MRYSEIIAESIITEKNLGRAFNHLEDLVFFYGSEGTIEALEHLKDVATEEGAKSIRMKWDGAPQVYWGREVAGGPLILAGHNGWARGAKHSSPEEIEDFIANQSGNPTSSEEKAQRNEFAKQFASLYPLFDAATPKDFVGFVYADSLFLDRPELVDNVYTFCPNPKSKTCYHVRKDSDLGRRISQAEVMVVGHAYFPEFGLPDRDQQPVNDFSEFNKTSKLIVQGPIYNSKPIKIDVSVINKVEAFVGRYKNNIDKFLESMTGLKDLKEILYRFHNQTAKAKRLDHLGSKEFFRWLESSTVSDGKKAKLQQLNDENNNAIESIFTLVKMIQVMKDNIIDQVEGEQGEIWDTHGEGRVRYADDKKQFGNVKFVPRKRWTP